MTACIEQYEFKDIAFRALDIKPLLSDVLCKELKNIIFEFYNMPWYKAVAYGGASIFFQAMTDELKKLRNMVRGDKIYNWPYLPDNTIYAYDGIDIEPENNYYFEYYIDNLKRHVFRLKYSKISSILERLINDRMIQELTTSIKEVKKNLR
mgnify:CR=1 FL=1